MSGSTDRCHTAVCPTCLSQNRAMLPLRDASRAVDMMLEGLHYEYIAEFTGTTAVCWECHSYFCKMLKFRRQVLDANTLLMSCTDVDKRETLASFTKLSISTSVGYHYEFSENNTEPLYEVNVKQEPTIFNDDIDSFDLSSEDKPQRKRSGKKPTTGKGKRAKKRTWAGTKVSLSGNNKNVKIVSVDISEEQFLRYREEDRKSKDYWNAPHKCGDCIKGFNFVSMLEKHRANYHSERIGPHECSVCAQRFGSPERLERHRRAHYKLYVCSVCGFPQRRLDRVLRHYRAAHQPGEKYPCRRCGALFDSARKMRYHHETKHKDIYQCEYCDKVLSNAQSLKSHILIHTGMPTLECSLCHKSCRGDSGLYTHMRTAHNHENAEEAYCKECDIQFKSKIIYKTHLRRSPKHNSPELFKFPCDKCEKRFKSDSTLKQHNRKYHLDYTCQICQKSLKNWFCLNAHIKFVHEGRQLPRKHVCELCGKAFKTKTILRLHQYVHTGERPYSCDICNASFTQKSTLGTHRKLIHLKLRRGDSHVQIY